MANGTLAITGDHDADSLLNRDPLALLMGMLLDQQVPMEWAFMGPYRLAERLGSSLGAAAIAEMDPDDFASLVKEKPALHRFPASMAGRIQQMCQHIVDEYDGDAEAVWRDVASGEELYRERLADGNTGFSGSAVAADDKLYFSGEDGSIHVVQAGPEFVELAVNDLGETNMATPAISEGRLYFRTRGHVVAVGSDE